MTTRRSLLTLFRHQPAPAPAPQRAPWPEGIQGIAVIATTACVAYAGTPCRSCVEACPEPGVLRLVRGRRAFVPAAAGEACTGCGECQRRCPSALAIRHEAGARGPVRVSAR